MLGRSGDNRLERLRAQGSSFGVVIVKCSVPTSVLVSLLRAQTRTIDFATSNLRGSPVGLYLGGARIEASFPMGPRAGVPLNVTVMSYCGELHLGIHSDPAAVVDPDLFLDGLRNAFAELATLG